MIYLDSTDQVAHLPRLMLSTAYSIILMSRLKTSTTPITLGMEADYLQFDFHISNISEFFVS
jgi:hypothetical protein